MAEAYIFDAIRTPRGRGKPNGSLHSVKPIDLLTILYKTIEKRNALDTSQVEDIIIGCVSAVDDQGGNIAKIAALYAGWAESVPGTTLNRFCASGLEACNLAAMKIQSNNEDLVLAGGVESMSRVPLGKDGGDMFMNPLVNRATHYIPQGISADLIATIEGFTREETDAFALASHQKAAHARKSGYFKHSIIPVKDINGTLILEQDETIREDANSRNLAKLKPSFADIGAKGFDFTALQVYPNIESIHHIHHPGNSSGIVDGAAAVLIGSEKKGKELGLKPRAKFRAMAVTASEPTIMLTGLIPASQKALRKAKLSINDIDLFEVNEAFASVVLKAQKELKLPSSKINPNGGAIAMGHPLGATGAMLLGTLLDELERQDKTLGLYTLCVGGGMGIATIIERI